MTTLNFQITTAGRQAAIDADATGLQLKITEVGYGNGTWSPDASATAPQDEFKRLPAGGGDNPEPLYVHVTTLDESSDSYQANEVAIYAGSVLFAIWSKGLQPGTDGPGKINTQDSAFAFDLLLTDVPPGSVTVGDTNFSVPLATETKAGVAREATQVEVNAGLLSKIFVSPAKLKVWWDQVRIWDNIKNKPATATRWPDQSEVTGLGTAATKDAGAENGNLALIGDLNTPGNTAVVVSSGSNANGSWRVWSDGFIEQWGEALAGYPGHIPIPYAIPFTVNPIAIVNSEYTGYRASGGISLRTKESSSLPPSKTMMYARSAGSVTDDKRFQFYVTGK